MTTDTAPPDTNTPPARSPSRYLLPFFLLVLIPMIAEGVHALAASADWTEPIFGWFGGWVSGPSWHLLVVAYDSTGPRILVLAVGAALVVFFMLRRRPLITYMAVLSLSMISVYFLVTLIFRHLEESYVLFSFALALYSYNPPLLTGLFVLKAAKGRYEQLGVLGVLGASVSVTLFPFVLATTPIDEGIGLGIIIPLSVASFFAALTAVWTVVRLEDTGTAPRKAVVALAALIIFIPTLLTLTYSPLGLYEEELIRVRVQSFFEALFTALVLLATPIGIGALGTFLLRRSRAPVTPPHP